MCSQRDSQLLSGALFSTINTIANPANCCLIIAYLWKNAASNEAATINFTTGHVSI